MIKIFDVSISSLSRREVLAQAVDFLHSNTTHFIFTPNAEILLEARKSRAYRDVLNSADLSLPDSIGVVLASKMIGRTLPGRISGVDFALELITHAAWHGERVVLVGGREGVVQKAAAKLVEKYPGLSIHAEPQNGSLGVKTGGETEEKGLEQEIISRIRHFMPRILLVAFGAPKQEFWIARVAPQLSSLRLAMGIGGAIDYWAGTAVRAPRILRILGLEWLWRLSTQPRRFPRIFRAAIIFPILILRQSIATRLR